MRQDLYKFVVYLQYQLLVKDVLVIELNDAFINYPQALVFSCPIEPKAGLIPPRTQTQLFKRTYFIAADNFFVSFSFNTSAWL